MTTTRAWLTLPFLLLAATVVLLLWWRPLDRIATEAPPVEEAVIEAVRLTPGLISVTVRSDGSEPVRIAQIQVDGAYRMFMAIPAAPTAWLGLTRLDIPYPWIDGEAHHLAFVTRTGVVIEHTIEVAQATPNLDLLSLWTLAGVGTLLGVIPIVIGLLAFPGMRTLSPNALSFILALTVGFLIFLLLDTIHEGQEAAAKTIGRMKGPTLFWSILAATTIGLIALGRRHGKVPEGTALAAFIALGVGLHNLGEGLAVGAALATGAAALATFLVVGFTIHNVTEGIGIAAPMTGERPSLLQFAGLAALAGLPAIIGTIIGTQAVSPLWIAVCFALGAGAILQVIIEVGALMARRAQPAGLFRPVTAGGVVLGLAVMYATSLLV